MSLKTFKAKVRVKSGNTSVDQVVIVQADSSYNARVMLEAQYGKGCIISSPQEVR